MLRNPLITFVLGGFVSAVIPVALADASRAGFVLGVLGVLGILGIALSSRKRVLWVSRFLARAAGQKVAGKVCEIDRVAPKAARAAANPNFADLVSGLRGLGASTTEARFAAGQATMRLPDGSFQDQFRLAVQVVKRTA